ncbi:MAG: hypothetical protein PVI92_11305 [Chromatiales bacterium]|jgi:hypothetical protein
MDSIANTHLNNDPDTIIAFPDDTWVKQWTAVLVVIPTLYGYFKKNPSFEIIDLSKKLYGNVF